MAVSAAERAHCALCKQFLVRRADWAGDWDAEESAYQSEAKYEPHDCAGYSSAAPVPASREEAARAMMSTASDIDGLDVVDMDATELDLVGLREVATLLGVKDQTVRQWRVRKLMPPARELSSGPVWTWATIERWAKRTGRLEDTAAAV